MHVYLFISRKKKQSQIVKAVTKFQIMSLATGLQKFEGIVENNGL